MYEKWKQFDSLILPMLFTDGKGRIIYKNDLAREMDLMRVGSGLTGKMDMRSAQKFSDMTASGEILTLFGKLSCYRCLAFPAVIDGTELVAMLFPGVLLGTQKDSETERILLRLVPSLRKLLSDMMPCLPYALCGNMGKKTASARLQSLTRKVLDLYLSDGGAEDDTAAVDIGYFLSVLTYFFREVFKYQGVSLSVSETAIECGYSFLEHRKLTALLISLIELIIDRTGSEQMYIDIYSEAGDAVVMFSAVLKEQWIMPDETLPDAFILMELLRRNGIDFEFFTAVTNEAPRMVCRLFLPKHIAKQSFSVFSVNSDAEACVIDFLEYLFVICAQ